ncbi:RimJ/RimL family protein N-acetyltransferase [Arthrobacter stackebrandtii]|uniref:RimJ/RimL family protein N-acetyltransferase n=1 Tax=Arthrobacter stackebrandtii TaxID=272161 RepID=A0ABS4YUX1_9MICC|nr:GNAT family protein [Arthrobacter stackebrandtii]MBP2412581.1 RimJ/RimL family protein N-acetyltransferase [Arthrobacter stackebrandtii]PYH02320.1 GNAT family N-acetyltransferase [Arthrobacter stackebrandtii]
MAPKISAPPQPAYPFTGSGIRLRPVTEADAPAVNAYRSLAEVARYLPHPPHTMADTRLTVASMASQSELSTPGQWLDLAVEHGDSAEAVGEVLLKWDAANPQRGEIGFVFSPCVQGRGIAFAACTAALDIAFNHFGWHRVEGICDDRNDKSAALMTRLGMRLEATFVEADWSKGEWITLRHYAVLKREWQARA